MKLQGVVVEPVTVTVDGHCEIEAVPGSRGVVVLSGGGNVSIDVGADADLTVVSLQESDTEGRHEAVVGRDAHYRHVAVAFGSRVRLQACAAFSAPGGRAELFGLHMTSGGQHHELRTYVDHNQPKTVSRVDYRGALQGKGARSLWVGDVFIRREAKGIDTYESNRNLLLTDGCVAESVPNLEIETGDIVGAGHSSATGHFDEEQLFYLRSRGIPEAVARRLVVQGFLGEIIGRIGVPVIEERLWDAVDEELDKVLEESHG